MKGISKALARTPHLVTSKVGITKKSQDPEFDDYHRKFATIEDATQKLLKDCGVFTENVQGVLNSGEGFATSFTNIFSPYAGEVDLIGKHAQAAETVRNVTSYQTTMEDLRSALAPELELIESRIVGPAKELQAILKLIRKNITKRDHKLTDFDRYNKSLTKLRDKKEKSLSDEKNLFKLEQDFEVASNDYETINTAMKTEMPRFFAQATQFIDPLFHSFYYMQLNVFYIMLEKFQAFCQDKYETGGSGESISQKYESLQGDTMERVEALEITKRIVSTAKMLQTRKATGGSSSSVTTTGPVVRSPTSSSTFSKKAPPPPPSLKGQASQASGYDTGVAPPPYSAGTVSGSQTNPVANKRPPPPAPASKPKPKPAEPPKKYVVALYDFAAQADGDLEFKAGDRIELVERTASAEDWWTGKVGGRQGVFPGNYVQEA